MSDTWERTKYVLSPSQVENFDLCHRLWWFKSVKKFPELPKGARTFGTVLHGVAERFLKADDLGRDPLTGKAVNLYPKGWTIAQEFDGSSAEINDVEQGIVRILIAKAIDEGFLARNPGRKIETPFAEQIGEFEGLPVMYQGKIDVLEPEWIVDHKTVKKRSYMKSANQLRKGVQGLTYARMALKARRFRGEAPLKTFGLAHVSYCKDPTDMVVRRTSVDVPVEEIEHFWTSTLLPTVDQMNAIRKIDVWHKIPDPPNMAKSCNAFGGCAFLNVCGQRETPEKYRERVEKFLKASKLEAQSKEQTAPEAQTTGVEVMGLSLDAKLAAGATRNKTATGTVPAGTAKGVNPPATKPAAPAAPKAPVAPPAGAAKPPVKPATPPKAPAAPVAPPKAQAAPVAPAAAANQPYTAPPWAREGCTACGGRGFNTKGAACRLCDSMQGQEQGLTSKHFIVQPIGNGIVVWVPVEGVEAEEGETFVPGAPNAATAQTRTAPTPPPAPAPEPEAAAEETVEETATDEEQQHEETPTPDAESEGGEDVVEPSGVNPPRGRGRPKVGFRLFINCVPVRSPGTIYHLDQVALAYQTDIAANKGAPSYFTLDPFKRRDTMCAGAQKLATEFGTATVVCCDSGSADMKALVDALRPLAYEIVEGMR